MKKVIKFIFNFYILWGRAVRFFERRKVDASKVSAKFAGKTVKQKWNLLLNLLHYERDKWHQLFDTVSDPYYVIKRGWGDCDDYAAAGLAMLGEKFTYRNQDYTHVGMFFVKCLRGGHAISIYKGKKDYDVISTRALTVYDTWRAIWQDIFRGKTILIAVSARLKAGAYFDLITDGVFYGSEIRGLTI